MAAPAGRGEPERRLEVRRGRVRVRHGDDQVVDPEQHPRSVRGARRVTGSRADRPPRRRGPAVPAPRATACLATGRARRHRTACRSALDEHRRSSRTLESMFTRLRRIHPALILAALDLFGLAVASYLSIVELGGGVPVCGPIKGCETVATSQYSRIGGVPVAVFGVGLSLILLVAASAGGRRAIDACSRPTTGSASSASPSRRYFTYLQVFVIDAICVWCASYGISLVLRFLSRWSLGRRARHGSGPPAPRREDRRGRLHPAAAPPVKFGAAARRQPASTGARTGPACAPRSRRRSCYDRGRMDGVVLVLNQNYEPLNVCNVPRAFRLVFGFKAEVVEYDHQTFRTPRAAYRAPSVIRLQHQVRRPRPRVKLSRREVFARDHHTCQYCGRQGTDLTLDHVIPRHRGGRTPGRTWRPPAGAATTARAAARPTRPVSASSGRRSSRAATSTRSSRRSWRTPGTSRGATTSSSGRIDEPARTRLPCRRLRRNPRRRPRPARSGSRADATRSRLGSGPSRARSGWPGTRRTSWAAACGTSCAAWSRPTGT